MFRDDCYFLENGNFIFGEISERFGKLTINYSKKTIRWECKKCGIILDTFDKKNYGIVMEIARHLKLYSAIIHMRYKILNNIYRENECEYEYHMFRSEDYNGRTGCAAFESESDRLQIKYDEDITGIMKVCVRDNIRHVRPNCDKCCICDKYIMEFNYHSRLFAKHIVDHLVDILDKLKLSCEAKK